MKKVLKKLKTKIKRTLAHFCREELLDYLGHKHTWGPVSSPNVVLADMELQQMEVALQIGTIGGHNPHMDPRMNDYETQLHEAKRQFAEFIMQHIDVETRELTSREHFGRRSVYLSLYVRKKRR